MILETFSQLNLDTRALVVATLISPIIPTVLTIVFFIIKNRFEKRKLIEERLFHIQQISFEYPYLEDEEFINTWDDFVNKSERINNKEKYLRYEQYCEMIFNLLELTYQYFGANKINSLIDFKSWVRIHEKWWRNPLDRYSNRDTYSKKVIEMIDDWIG